MVCGFLAMEVMMNVLSTREDGVTLIPRKLSGWGLALRSEDVVPIYCVRGSPEYTCRPGWPSGGLTPFPVLTADVVVGIGYLGMHKMSTPSSRDHPADLRNAAQ